MNHQKKVILFTALLLMITMSSLAWIERSQRDFSNGKDWWALSFVDPSPASSTIDFTIENFSDSETFTYQVISNQNQSEIKTVTIPKSSSTNITVTQNPPAQIQVTTGDQTKSIYK